MVLGRLGIQYNSLEDLTNKIEDELNKCQIICKNCHALKHSDLEFYEKYKDEIEKKSKNLKEVQPKIDRKKVKELYDNGIKQVDIAKYFKAKKGTISGIIKEIKGGLSSVG